MHFAIVTLVASCLTAAVLVDGEVATPEFLQKQMTVYDLFWHVDQPEAFPRVYDIGKSYDMTANMGSYKNEQDVTKFWKLYKRGMLPRGEIFSVFCPTHLEQAIALFKVFYTSKDFETLYKTAAWARIYVNEGLFVYAFSVAVTHRPDTQRIRVPAYHEIYPFLYFSNEVIREAYNVKAYTDPTKTSSGDDPIVIGANSSNSDFFGRENKLRYFTEDVAVNEVQYYAHLAHPFWMSTKDYNLPSKIRGEIFFLSLKLQLTRYYMERLSNGIGEVEDLDWNYPLPYGFSSSLSYHNGMQVPERPVGAVVPSYKYKSLRQLRDYEQRISMAIDLGKVMDTEGKVIPIRSPEGIQVLGNMVEGNADSVNYDFYGSYYWVAKNVFGFSPAPVGEYKVLPSMLQHYGVDQRDPIYWSLGKNILGIYDHFMRKLPKYTEKELAFPGVKINSVKVGPITTFFEDYDYFISGAVKVRGHDDMTVIKARQQRLSHKPYTYTIDINSEKDVKAYVRIFLGPKYCVDGMEIPITKNYKNFMLLDGWVVDLKVGSNKMKRKSTDAWDTRDDEISGDLFYKKMVKASKGEETYEIPEKTYGYPRRMVIPRGTKDGMTFQVYVFVTPVEGKKMFQSTTLLSGNKEYLDVPFGFPLERPVTSEFTQYPNGFFQDVVVVHKEESEVPHTA